MTNDIALTLKPADGGPSARIVLVNPRYNGPGTEVNPWLVQHDISVGTFVALVFIVLLNHIIGHLRGK